MSIQIEVINVKNFKNYWFKFHFSVWVEESLVSFKRKSGKVCDIFVQLSVNLLAIVSVYLRETSTKPLGMLTHLLALVIPASIGQQVRAAAAFLTVNWLDLSTGLCYSLLLTVSFWPLSNLPSLVHFRSRERFRAQAVCVGFAPKQRKGSSEWHPHTTTAHHRVTVSFVN